MIHATMIGRAVRITAAGEDGASIALACERYDYKSKEKATSWVSVLVWGKRKEFVLNQLKVQDWVVVSGDLYTDEYEKDGVKKQSLKCFAHSVDWAPGSSKKGE